MKKEDKIRWGLIIFSALLFGSSMYLLFPLIGWKGMIGVLLLIWSNNLDQTIRDKF